MRKLFVSTLVSLVCVVPALAQDAHETAGPPAAQDAQSAVPNTAQNPHAMPDVQSIEAILRTRLADAGFTDIEMMPTSFLVRAKDAEGNPVMLVLSPGSASHQGGQDDDASTPSGQQSF